MDVCGVYVGDVGVTYGSMRSSYYRDYEQFPYGSLEHNYSTQTPKDSYSQVQAKYKQIKSEKSDKKQCPFCKEAKKRPLTKYLRKREIHKHNERICEDDEEEHQHEKHEQDGKLESTK